MAIGRHSHRSGYTYSTSYSVNYAPPAGSNYVYCYVLMDAYGDIWYNWSPAVSFGTSTTTTIPYTPIFLSHAFRHCAIRIPRRRKPNHPDLLDRRQRALQQLPILFDHLQRLRPRRQPRGAAEQPAIPADNPVYRAVHEQPGPELPDKGPRHLLLLLVGRRRPELRLPGDVLQRRPDPGEADRGHPPPRLSISPSGGAFRRWLLRSFAHGRLSPLAQVLVAAWDCTRRPARW